MDTLGRPTLFCIILLKDILIVKSEEYRCIIIYYTEHHECLMNDFIISKARIVLEINFLF